MESYTTYSFVSIFLLNIMILRFIHCATFISSSLFSLLNVFPLDAYITPWLSIHILMDIQTVFILRARVSKDVNICVYIFVDIYVSISFRKIIRSGMAYTIDICFTLLKENNSLLFYFTFILPSCVGVFQLHIILISYWLKGAVHSHLAAQVKMTQPLLELAGPHNFSKATTVASVCPGLNHRPMPQLRFESAPL